MRHLFEFPTLIISFKQTSNRIAALCHDWLVSFSTIMTNVGLTYDEISVQLPSDIILFVILTLSKGITLDLFAGNLLSSKT